MTDAARARGAAPWCRRCGRTSPSAASTSPSPARSTTTSAPPSTTSCARPRRASGSWPGASGTRSGPTVTSCPRTSLPRRELIQMFCDVVAKNGNLLHRHGPAAGRDHPRRCSRRRCAGSGRGSTANGEAIYGSRPWVVTESVTRGRDPVALHQERRGRVRAGVGDAPGRRVTHAGDRRCAGAAGAPGRGRRAAGVSVESGGDLSVTLPERLPVSAVTVLDLGTDVRARPRVVTVVKWALGRRRTERQGPLALVAGRPRPRSKRWTRVAGAAVRLQKIRHDPSSGKCRFIVGSGSRAPGDTSSTLWARPIR